MASSAESADFVATLFNRPPLPSASGANATFLTDELLESFVSTLQRIDNGVVKHKSRSLDGDSPHIAAVTYSATQPFSAFRAHASIAAFEQQHSIEVVLQPAVTQRKGGLRLAVFDMDSTLIQQEVIDLLASVAGVEDQVSTVTARAMNGELDFGESLRARVALLAGLRADVFEGLKPRLTLTPGADTLLRALKRLGVATALLSGGFTPLARYIGDKLGIDHVHANELAVSADGDALSGELAADAVVVDSARKKALLQSIAAERGVSDTAGILAVGDGANDLPMLWAAGLGVAVNAKPRVQADAPARLNGPTALLDVLYLLGLTTDEIDRLAEEA